MAWPNILDRFRPVGSPGPLGRAGVPAHDDQGAEAELGAVFAALAPDVESCLEIVNAARSRAEVQLTHARERAKGQIAEARLGAAEERARAAASVARLAAAHDAQVLRRADDEAAAIRQIGAERIPALVRSIMDDVLTEPLPR